MCGASNGRDVQIVLKASVSRRGQQDALRQGVRPTDRIMYTVDARHPRWQRVVALDPEIIGSYIGVPLNRSWEIHVANETHGTEPLTSEPSLGWVVWRYPDAEIRWGEPQPLDEWPTIDRLIEMEEKHRAAAQRALTEVQHDLDEEVRPAWREWMRAFADECRKRHHEWMNLEPSWATSGSAGQQTLAAFQRAFEAFDPHTGDAPERASRLYSLFFEVDRHMEGVVREVEAAKRRKDLVAEATAWTHEHGSARLRKALDAGLMASALGVYRDERLALEHPGWVWFDDGVASGVQDIEDPSEPVLDAFLAAREWDPGAELKWLDAQDGGVAVVVASFLDRRIYLPG